MAITIAVVCHTSNEVSTELSSLRAMITWLLFGRLRSLLLKHHSKGCDGQSNSSHLNVLTKKYPNEDHWLVAPSQFSGSSSLVSLADLWCTIKPYGTMPQSKLPLSHPLAEELQHCPHFIGTSRWLILMARRLLVPTPSLSAWSYSYCQSSTRSGTAAFSTTQLRGM